MKITGSSVLHAPPESVWAAITDPAVLAVVIPGCDSLTPLAKNRFALTLTLGVASIKGVYTGEVTLSDLRKPESLTMHASGSGGPGTIDTTVRVTLTPLTGGGSTVHYDADAMVGGMVGGVGQRVLAGVAKKTAGLFFAAIDDVLTGAHPVREQAAGAVQTAAAALPTAAAPLAPPAAPMRSARRGALTLIGAAAFGAVSMLVGVLVGARIGARRET